jgi:hypothetical protein
LDVGVGAEVDVGVGAEVDVGVGAGVGVGVGELIQPHTSSEIETSVTTAKVVFLFKIPLHKSVIVLPNNLNNSIRYIHF